MNAKSLLATVAAVAATLSGYVASQPARAQAQLSQPTYEYRLERNVMVPMKDGTKLATDIYIPVTDTRVPALVVRTPYNKELSSNPEYGKYYASRGYAVAIQDVRGRFASEGEFYNYLNDGDNEHKDGYDAIEWVAAQPWCNGNIGTLGGSYRGLVQYLVATARPPHLKAMVPAMAPADYYQEMRYSGGALQGQAPQWEVQNESMVDELNTSADFQRWMGKTKREEAPTLLSFFSKPFMDWIEHPADGPYWWQFAPNRKYHLMDVPMMHFGGWYDRYAMGIPANYEGVTKQGGSEKTRKAQKLVMGPWPHSYDTPPSKLGELDFGPSAAMDVYALRLRWFDYWLKGIDNGIMNDPPVHIFVMGDNEWRFENEWPLARTRSTAYYFHNTSRTSTHSLNDGVLSLEPPAANGKPATYGHDPHDPLPTIGGDNRFGKPGPIDQREVDKRSLTYTTPPLTEDVEVTGNATVVLYVSSSAVDTDFTAMISDVYPDGRSLIMRNNIIRAKYRDSFEKPTLLQPDRVYKVTIKMAPFSNVFKKGHAIRVGIASSNFPKYIPNPGTGLDFGKGATTRKAENTVYHDAKQASHVILPIIPRSVQPTSAAKAAGSR